MRTDVKTCRACGVLICKQHEVVTINGKVISLAVDHDHATGVFRGLLCSACNEMLGLARDNARTLMDAIYYPQGELWEG